MRHNPGVCQLCDMYEYISNWGPTVNNPWPEHKRYFYEECDDPRSPDVYGGDGSGES